MATLACTAGETGNLVPVEKSDQAVLTHTLQAIVQTLHKLLIFTTRSQDLLLNMCSVVFEKIGKFLCKKNDCHLFITLLYTTNYQGVILGHTTTNCLED